MAAIDVISKIWAETLNVAQVEPSDSFFELGGDSLMITIMAFRLEGELDLVVNVDLVFDHPTLEEFTNALLSDVGLP